MLMKAGQRRKCYTMAWENRTGSGRYYTRSKRVNGRIVREYIGNGQYAELMYQADVVQRCERKAEQAAFHAIPLGDSELDRKLNSLDELSNAIASGFLILAGYHQHKRGNWRKRNG